jgi:predicted amidophosphoribosyltransferase
LVVPLVVMGTVTFVLIVAYVNKVSRVTAQAEANKKPTVCPACGHKLVEVRNFCAECGASIWPPESDQPPSPDVSPERPQ